jgi:hypothetical protein
LYALKGFEEPSESLFAAMQTGQSGNIITQAKTNTTIAAGRRIFSSMASQKRVHRAAECRVAVHFSDLASFVVSERSSSHREVMTPMNNGVSTSLFICRSGDILRKKNEN